MSRFSQSLSPEIFFRRIVGDDIEQMLARTRKKVGSFGFDAWGYDESRVALGAGLVQRLYERYFRVQTYGLENIPPSGRLLIVGNHSGQLPLDGLLVGYALLSNPKAPRASRAMIERFFPTVPFLGNLLNSLGAVIGDPVNCARMLEHEEAIIVFPEGVRGSGKPYSKRYQLQRFGEGFVHLATQHQTPIIPVGIVGCEETMPSLGNNWPLAKLLGIPYAPIVPSLIPLPARVSLNFGKPIKFAGKSSDQKQIDRHVNSVKSAIADLIDQGLARREGIYW